MKQLLLALLSCIAASTALAGDSYYNRDKEKGWYWYEKTPPPPPEPEPAEPPKPPDPIVIIQAPPPEKPPEAVEPEGPPALSSAWLKANLETYLFKAMDDPTPENVTAYLYLHRLMMDKSSMFADSAQVALANEPMLSNDVRRPRFEAASSIMSKRASEEASLLLREVADKGRYVMVVSSQCDTCGPFSISASTLAKQSGAQLDLVTIDGAAPPSLGPKMADVRADPKLIAALKPITTPSLYLLRQDGKSALVTASPMPATDMVTTAINIAYGQGWISDVAYQKTRSRNNVHIAVPADQPIPDEALENPQLLADYLRSKMTVGASQ